MLTRIQDLLPPKTLTQALEAAKMYLSYIEQNSNHFSNDIKLT